LEQEAAHFEREQVEYYRLRTEWLRNRSQLSDSLTGLPTLPAVLDQARQLLTAGALDVAYFDLGLSGTREARVGWESYDDTIRVFADRLQDLREGGHLAPEEPVCVRTVRADRFLLFLGAAAQQAEPGSPESRAAELAAALREGAPPGLGSFAVGFSRVLRDPAVRPERALQRGVIRAMLACLGTRSERRVERLEALSEIIARGAVRTVFEPVLRPRQGLVIGHEALTRPMLETVFDSVEDLFGFAESTDRQLEFERVCRQSAIQAAGSRPAPGFLFLNASARGVADPDWQSEALSGQLAESGLVPNQVVIEVPERLVAEGGVGFHRAVKGLQRHGFRIAIDDAGAGYATPQTLADLRPDFLKLDVGLVRGMHLSPIKRDLARGLLDLARRLGAHAIAEGVELPEERGALLGLGIEMAQGRLFRAGEAG
jgi:EAL domain-containing protein (putative c-di-GMP-specific phosphodiesterase class I)